MARERERTAPERGVATHMPMCFLRIGARFLKKYSRDCLIRERAECSRKNIVQ